jgi:hypothetical protein
VREVRTLDVGDGFEFRQLDDLVCLLGEVTVLPGDRPEVERPTVVADPGDPQVVRDVQALEYVRDLERPREVEPVDFLGLEAADGHELVLALRP